MAKKRVNVPARRTFLQNMGPVSSMWLAAVGIETLDDLQRTGLEEAFRRLILHGFNVNALMLYGMEGALEGIHWNAIGTERKAALREIAGRVKAECRKKQF